MKASALAGCAALIAAGAAGCTVGPDYVRPAAIVPAVYKEAKSLEAKGLTRPRPRDALDRGDWWVLYHDSDLDRLERLIVVDNQTLKAAEAAYREAQAIVREARAQLYPTLTATPTITRTNNSPTQVTFEAMASWEPDLWGRVRRTIENDLSSAQASAADVANAKLSAQASLATDYFELREADALEALLNDSVRQYQRSLKITQNQYNAGTAARSDVITAQTQVLTTQAQAINAGVARAQYEHAIAVLTGHPPAELSLAKKPLTRTIPAIPAGLPSTLLERRPDIAAAERTMQAQNALVGVAISAFYPDVTLSASGGFSAFIFTSAMQAASTAVYSLTATATQTLFNGGLTQAQVDAARAAYDQSVANYRQTVLSGFQQVEDQLSTLRILGREAVVQDQAVKSAEQAVTIALNEYQAGTQNFTVVVTAQAIALGDEESALTIREERIAATVALIEALGGGWDVSQLPTD